MINIEECSKQHKVGDKIIDRNGNKVIASIGKGGDSVCEGCVYEGGVYKKDATCSPILNRYNNRGCYQEPALIYKWL